ncbi:MAG: cytochrome [Actinomycetia bacterium]|nr:cytochrome [Actinomycetes bacterium]
MSTTQADLAPFNPWNPELLTDPYPIYARYREADPIHWGTATNPELPGSWYLFRYDDNLKVLTDAATFASNPGTVGKEEVVPPAFNPVAHIFHRWLGAQDPPSHTRQRSVMVKAFTPKRVAALRPRIELIASQLMDEALARSTGKIDIITDLSFPLPMTVVGDAMGVPQEDWHRFRTWSEEVSNAVDTPGVPEVAAAGAAAIEGMAEYFRSLVHARRANPGDDDDLLSAMIAAADDEGGAMTEFDMIAIATEIAVAGHETTANGVAKSIVGMMQQRERWEELKAADDERLATAVEELLRWSTPVAKQRWRWATKDVEIADQPVAYGESVVSMLAAANHDPAQFPDPDRIDFTRPTGRHLTFGFGSHFCLGSSLARLEMGVALKVLGGKLPDMELADPDNIPMKPNQLMPGPSAVWVTTP